MNRLFLLLFGAVTFVAHAQVPDYVPTEGLVAWYPFNGNANDESGNGYDFNSGAYTFVEDQLNANSSAIAFDQLNSAAATSLPNSFIDSQEATYSFWWRVEGAYNYNGYNLLTFPGPPGSIGGNFLAFTIGENWYWLGCENSSSGFTATARIGFDFHIRALDCATYPEMSSWNHTAVTCTSNSLELYFNGIFIGEESVTVDFGQTPEGTLSLGVHNNPSQSSLTVRIMDDLGLWNRALTASEVLALYNAESLLPGCTDPTACNFDEEATSDDGSCIPSGCMEPLACNYNALAECPGDACDYTCCPGPGCCLDGTTWDAELGGCVPDDANDPVDPTANSCPQDLDFDGVVGVGDLMDLLSVFGTNCPTNFTCGDPFTYHGYDYATVQIGEQCWFAENLRAEQYQNGDLIPGNLDDDAWTNTTDGAQAILNENEENLEMHGRLYNFYAVLDERGLCPAGWHVPADEEWITLGEELGGIEVAGAAMKNSGSDTPPWDGTNSSHWNGTPGGKREMAGWYAGSVGYWWTSTPFGCGGWHRNLHPNLDALTLSSYCNVVGFSVRCLKD